MFRLSWNGIGIGLINDVCTLVQTHKRDRNMEYNILIETDFFNLLNAGLVKSEQAHPLGDGEKPFTRGQK